MSYTQRITITDEDGLKEVSWSFTNLDSRHSGIIPFILDSAITKTRPSRRHKFQILAGQSWERLRFGSCARQGYKPKIPQKVRDVVMSRIKDAITIED